VSLEFRFQTKLTAKTKVWFRTKLKLSSPASNQMILMYLDRQLLLNTYR